MAGAGWRILITPIDTCKTMLQTDGAQGWAVLKAKAACWADRGGEVGRRPESSPPPPPGPLAVRLRRASRPREDFWGRRRRRSRDIGLAVNPSSCRGVLGMGGGSAAVYGAELRAGQARFQGPPLSETGVHPHPDQACARIHGVQRWVHLGGLLRAFSV